MSPEVKAAWIGSSSALIVAIITAVSTYFVAVKTQTAQPDPIVIREPYIVTQKEVIREYYKGSDQPAIKKDVLDKSENGATPSTPTAKKNDEELEDDLNVIALLTGKKIGIYYSLGHNKTKSVAGQLVGRMIDRRLDATYYSIGRTFKKPDVPNRTYIFGLDTDVDTKKFLESFTETFHFIGPIDVSSGPLKNKPVIDNETWHITLDKDLYIVVGD